MISEQNNLQTVQECSKQILHQVNSVQLCGEKNQIQVDQNVIFMLKLSFLVAQEPKKQKPPEAARAKH